MKKNFNIYSVEYSAGWGGTWLTWLINQHLDTKIEIVLNYDPVQQDFGLGESKSADGEPLDKNPFHWHHTIESFDEFVERSGHTESFCYKLMPMHNWFEPEGRTMKPNYTKYRFMPYIDQILAKEFILRKIITVNVNDNWRSTRTSEGFKNDPYGFGKDVASQPLKRLKQHISNPIHKNIIPIDMGKLVSNDKNEYNKILERIECNPLPDIESYFSRYVEQALHTRNNPLIVINARGNKRNLSNQYGNASIHDIKMLRVDGHDCWHELLNNDPITNLHTQDALRLRLVDAEAICTEVSWLNINEVGNILKEYLPEFPNIKRAVFYRSPVPYLNPQYSDSVQLVDFNIFQHSNHPIDVEFQDLDNLTEQQLQMPELHIDQSLNHLENLYWVKNDEEFYYKVKKEETYYKWYQIIHLNRPEYSLNDYHSMIKSKLL